MKSDRKATINEPIDLTNEIVQKLGQNYLAQKYTMFHTNHAIAKELTSCNMTSAENRWLLLINAYIELEAKGSLAGEIEKYLKDAFNLSSIETTRVTSAKSDSEALEGLSMKEIHEKLTNIITYYFTVTRICEEKPCTENIELKPLSRCARN